MKMVAEASDGKSLRKAVTANPESVLVVDPSSHSQFSLDVIGKIRADNPALKVLVLSWEKSGEAIKNVISHGINNYVHKDSDPREITEAIVACSKGQKCFCSKVVQILLEKELADLKTNSAGKLSDREVQVIKELVSGKRPREIAKRMELSYHTIVTHKRNIYAKLGIKTTIELAQYAVRNGLMK